MDGAAAAADGGSFIFDSVDREGEREEQGRQTRG